MTPDRSMHPNAGWPQVVRVAATGSTNSDVVGWAQAGAPEGSALVTDDQRSGRGRLNRSWTTAPGASLALSVLLRPVDVPAQRWSWLPLLAGVAIHDAVCEAWLEAQAAGSQPVQNTGARPVDPDPPRSGPRQRTDSRYSSGNPPPEPPARGANAHGANAHGAKSHGPPPHEAPSHETPSHETPSRGTRIEQPDPSAGEPGPDPVVTLKWPNDVLLDGEKVAGILVERHETPLGAAAVVGIGLNLHRHESFPLGATALEAPDSDAVLDRLLSWLHWHYTRWRAVRGDVEPVLRPRYVSVCSTLGREVRVHLPTGQDLNGWAHDVDNHGRLVVLGPAGDVSLAAGDVVHVRPRFP